MEPIVEEREVGSAFSNLVYSTLEPARPEATYQNVQGEAKYENVTEDAKYENVQERINYENVPKDSLPGTRHQVFAQQDISQNEYENVCVSEDADAPAGQREHYENYDFGESGIYQNILFQSKPEKANNDVYTQIKILKEAMQGVNDILMKEPTSDDQCEESSSSDQSGDIQVNSMNVVEEHVPVEDIKVKGKVSAIRDMFSFHKNKEPTGAVETIDQKSNNNPAKAPTPAAASGSVFKRWALARAEHPVMDLEKLPGPRQAGLFTSTEREIVAKFLENVKSELTTV
jgi:hypothetical protein